MPQIVAASKDGSLKEIFGSGTVSCPSYSPLPHGPSLTRSFIFVRPPSYPASRVLDTKTLSSPSPAALMAVRPFARPSLALQMLTSRF